MPKIINYFIFLTTIFLIHGKQKRIEDFKKNMNQQQEDLEETHKNILKFLNFKESDWNDLSKEDLVKYEEKMKKVLNFYNEALDGFDSNEKKIYSWVFLDIAKLDFILKTIEEKKVIKN